jgi:hypothetical protein
MSLWRKQKSRNVSVSACELLIYFVEEVTIVSGAI